MSYPVEQQLLAINIPYVDGSPEQFTRPLKGLVQHSTDNPGATAQGHHDYWNRDASVQASVHYIVDWNRIIQLVPENVVAWHVGHWTANREWLGVEFCEPADSDPDRFRKFDETWKRCTWLVASVFNRRGWNTKDYLWSHNGLRSLYAGVNHTDPYEFFKKYGKTWADYCAAVDAEIARQASEASTPPIPSVETTKPSEPIVAPVAGTQFSVMVFYRGRDLFSAEILGEFYCCPTANVDTQVTPDLLKLVDKKFMVGGSEATKVTADAELLAGADLRETARAVIDHIYKMKGGM
jgi:N-acetylmuramoyl-L-alanine amidase CwlA